MLKIAEQLENRPFFTSGDVANLVGITRESAWVLCSRYTAKGYFVRLKRDYYATSRSLNDLSRETAFTIANFLQVPSCISLLTALEFYEATTQVSRGVYESTGIKRSVTHQAGPVTFRYYKLDKKRYGGFDRKGGIFIASPEKALLDAVYLYSFGKYRLDAGALVSQKFNAKELEKISRPYPAKTRTALERICRTW